MKSILTILFALIFYNGFSQRANRTDTLRSVKKNADTALHVNGIAVLSKIGFAPIPFFSFDKPIVAFFLSLSKGNFSYDPGFADGLTGEPWYINNWIKYGFIDKNKLQIGAGVNPGLIFINAPLPANAGTTIATRNLFVALFGNYNLSNNLSFKFTYWYNYGFDSRPLSGHFLDVTGIISNIGHSKYLLITIKPELFYFNNFGKVDGLFTSATFSIGRTKFPVSLYLQGVEKLWTDFPAKAFNWNCGLVYAF